MIGKFGFELLKEQEIPELNTHARVFQHIKTGARLLSLHNQDENKVFGITFRTPPEDSSGVAHIMEHSVLCGSEKYPLKEPFIQLVQGSLYTFLNAFTYPDKTCYPVASQNQKDFYNLIDVYMDAVLHPLIVKNTLFQEGWHYELDNLDAPLVYKGVVFNEMKGAASDPDDVLNDGARISLFPDNAYGVNSGGDPRDIPNLTYEKFKDFHDRYYHPSNAWIYFYGDDDPDERLRRMNAYLDGFEALSINSTIPLQPAFREPRRVDLTYDPGENTDALKGMLVLNWQLTEAGDPTELLGLSILAHILIGTPASPLRKALIDSGLGEDLAGVGLEAELRQAFFSTGLKGVKAEPDGSLPSGAQIEALIFEVLKSLAEQGIDPEMVAASMNTVEFRLRENNTGSFPRGLLIMLRALTTWLHGLDPILPLAFEQPLNQIKADLGSGRPYFENLIARYFLNNPHQTTVTLKPEPGLQARRDEQERERLAEIREKMNQQDLQAIIDQTRTLKELQGRPDPPELLDLIPTLTLQDLDKEEKQIPLEILEAAEARLLYHDLFTNGIIYLDLGFDLHTLPGDLLPYVPLFGRALLEMGTDKEDYVRLSQRIGRSTGGIHSTSFTSMVSGINQGAARLFLRSKATMVHAPELMSILEDILLTGNLENQDRFRQIVLEEKADLEAMLVPAGHQVVNTRLRACFNEADWAAERMRGIEQLFFVRSLIQSIDENWPQVKDQLEALRRILLNRRTMVFNATLDAQNWSVFLPQLREFVEKLPTAASSVADWKRMDAPRSEGLIIPAQVNYVAKGADLYRLGYRSDGSIEVITRYLATTWLWEKVRIQGGAYGGLCQFNHRSGVFTYISYRDPNLLETLENYDQTAAFLRRLELDPGELTRSIIGSIGERDAYQLPDAKGFTSMQRYLVGDTIADRQARRDQILTTTLQDFRDFGETLSLLNDTGLVVVLGSKESITRANSERGAWLQIQNVL